MARKNAASLRLRERNGERAAPALALVPMGIHTQAAFGRAERAAPAAHEFRPDIQGLRAIAVLSVVLYHADTRLISGGFVGVDIFFVISGYLIAGILMGELERGGFSLLGFYERRVRRLFPALFTMLAAAALAGAVLLPATHYNDFARNAFSTIFFASNIDFYLHSGYFDAEAHARPLLHTWSLAVEEQFYLAFPLLLAALFSVARLHLRWVLAAFTIVSLVACEFVVRESATAAFFLAPFRAFELLTGAVIARLPFPAAAPQGARDALSLAGLALIGVGLFGLSDASRFPGLSAVAPCLGTACVLYAGAGGASLAGRWIATPSFAFFGAISYSLYLWHWPIFVFARFALLRPPTAFENAALIALAVALASASWFWIEQRFLKRRGRPWRAIGVGLATMAAGAGAAFAVARLDGLPQRFGAPASHLFQAAQDASPARLRCHNSLDRLHPYADNCVLGAEGATPHWALWGDSHGTELAFALSENLGAHEQALLQITNSGCPPALGFSTMARPLCAEQNQLIARALAQDERIETVVFAASFTGYAPADRARLAPLFAQTVETIAGAGKRIVLVYPIPIFEIDAPSALGLLAQRGADPGAFGLARSEFDRATQPAREMLDQLALHTGALAIRPEFALCDAARCRAYDPAHGALYFNNNHLSMAGARLLVAQLLPERAHASVAP